jgi:hypothetical protein
MFPSELTRSLRFCLSDLEQEVNEAVSTQEGVARVSNAKTARRSFILIILGGRHISCSSRLCVAMVTVSLALLARNKTKCRMNSSLERKICSRLRCELRQASPPPPHSQ